jgi:hypothetical protein
MARVLVSGIMALTFIRPATISSFPVRPSYLDCVLQTHGWEKPSARESDRHDSVPLSPDAVIALMQVPAGPAEGTMGNWELKAGVGFGYRQVLGELVYAYNVCRLDIGFAITLLSRFTSAPVREHYLMLKNVVRYLRCTKEWWGIVYWC